MKESLNNFINLLIKGDFLLVLLVIMILVIISVIFYLVKLELSQRDYLEDTDEEGMVEESINNTINTQIKEPINETIHEIKTEEPRQVVQLKMEEKKTDDVFDMVQNYEDEQEEVAIISADELDSRLKNMKETGEVNLHEKEIERYENEQEEKAIISYEELLKRASTGVINYESHEDIGGIRVSKVDFDKSQTITIDDRPYAREENFLEALKEFRRSL